MIAPKLILIVDDDDLPARSTNPLNQPSATDGYVPNFTTPTAQGAVAASNAVPALTDSAVLARRLMDASVLVAAIALPLSSVIPVIAGVIGSASRPENDDMRARREAEVARFLERHAVSERNARAHGLRFAPGHPRAGEAYRLHPLAGVEGANRDLFYIPEASFDQVLLDEREAELLRLLVQLGATRISISERQTRNESAARSASGAVSAVGVGDARASSADKTGSRSDGLHTREFQLVGRPATRSDRIVEHEFAWLSFEPSWKSLVWARERGQCTRAVIELKEETDFSNERKMSAGLKAAAYGGASLEAAKALNQLETRSHMFQVDFAPFTGQMESGSQ